MTKTALENRAIASRERIAREQREHERRENIKDRGVQVATAAIGALGRVGASSIKSGASKGAAKSASTPVTRVTGIPMRNDVRWYKKAPGLESESTNIPGFYPNGLPIAGAYDTLAEGRTPQIGVLYYVNSFGNTRSPDGSILPAANNTINLTAQQFMSQLREFNSRIGEYEPADLLQAVIGMIDIFAFITHLGRMIASFYHFNHYAPNVRRGVLAAMGYELSEVEEHIKDYEKAYATMAMQANRLLTVPADMSLLARKLYLNGTVFKEAEGDNAQYIITEPLDLLQFDELRSSCRPIYDSASWNTLSGTINQFNNLLSQFQLSTFCTTLMADMRAAKGLALYAINDVVSHELSLKPVDEIMNQLMNANLPTLVGNSSLSTNINSNGYSLQSNGSRVLPAELSYNLYNPKGILNALKISTASGTVEMISHIYLNQDSNGQIVPCLSLSGSSVQEYILPVGHGTDVSQLPRWDAVSTAIRASKLLNYYKNDVTGDDILESTRFQTRWDVGYNDNAVSGDYDVHYTVVSTGTEIPICFAILNGTVTNFEACFGVFDYYQSEIFAFNYKPTVYKLQTKIVAGNPAFAGFEPIQQWDKIIELPYNNAFWLNEVAVKSEIFVTPPSAFKLD